VDCEDGDCSAELYCYESDCEDDDDEDEDGLVDCEDDDCWADAVCELVVRVTSGQMVINRSAAYDIYPGGSPWPASYTSATITDIVGTGEVAGEGCVWSLESARLQNTYVDWASERTRQVIDRDGFDTDCVGLSVTDLPQSFDFGLGRIDTADGGLWYHGSIDTWVGPRSSTWTYVFDVDATWYWRVNTLSTSEPWAVE